MVIMAAVSRAEPIGGRISKGCFHSSALAQNSQSHLSAATSAPSADKKEQKIERDRTRLDRRPSESSSRLSFLVDTVRAFLAPRSAAAHKRLDILGSRWNELSGYDEVQRLKREVSELERNLSSLRAAQAAARAHYLQSVTQRSNSQAAITDLLTRKASWSDADLSKYTSLLRSEHAEARAAKEAEEGYERAEKETSRGWDELMKRVLERYHEEQVWSDKIRTASTWGSFVVVGLNVLIFLMAIIIVEPYKRRALLRAAEARIIAGEEKSRHVLEQGLQRLADRFSAVEERLRVSTGDPYAVGSSGAPIRDMPPQGSGGVSQPTSFFGQLAQSCSYFNEKLRSATLGVVEVLSPIPPPSPYQDGRVQGYALAMAGDLSKPAATSFANARSEQSALANAPPEMAHDSIPSDASDASTKRRRDKHTRDIVAVSAVAAVGFASLLRAWTDS